MLTQRDFEALQFIKNNPCRSDVIQKLFYPSYSVAMRRLNKMVDEGYCKRYRETPNNKYFYYYGTKPKQLEHMDLTARSILWIKSKGYDIINFKREVKLDGIRPDAVAAISRGNKIGVVMIEIERFNNKLNKKIDLYEKEFISKKHFNSFKIIYVCSSKVTNNRIDIINIKPCELYNA